MGKTRDVLKEKNFFLLMTGLNLLPILAGKYFPTMDGPAHLYNSQLINTLLFENDSLTGSFFILNPEPVPNWTGHFILSFFNLFLPAFMAEKILLFSYVIAFPFSFRALVKTISINNLMVSYLIFPFTYSFLLFVGFYNFCIGLVFMLITLNYWLKNENMPGSAKNILKLFLLITLTYFSHVFVFAILLLVIGMHIMTQTTISIALESSPLKEILCSSFRKFCMLLSASFLPLLLLFWYFYSRPADGMHDLLEHTNTGLFEKLKNMRPVIAVNFRYEETLAFCIILILSLIVLYKQVKSIQPPRRPVQVTKHLLSLPYFWLLVSGIMLFLYLRLPDSGGQGSFISARLALLFFIFFVLWLSVQTFPRRLGLFTAGSVFCIHLLLNLNHTASASKLSTAAAECTKASAYIRPHSIVLPLNYSSHWLQPHFPHYLGVDKPMVILENYEAETGYFPVKWNERLIPNTLLGNSTLDKFPCIQRKVSNTPLSLEIDYVFVLGNMEEKRDSCSLEIKAILERFYEPVYTAKQCWLYQRKNITAALYTGRRKVFKEN